ncbi:class I SAM-dependent methyltransferase [Luteibacter yeojuensis]|uniref:Class I SAM-dependent methyltransferase n=1 Tax=Luteibacter yeojuensis TaxID=345309 RepID=A0A7X5TQ54_9GAMM|nr:class I SAM-dependent methyltransferase [Luteibacter yeojuensis]NID15439.1 class I SAM-dependent methyltransferase [Luteibacter yeojuensis]
MTDLRSTERFSDRVEDYVRYRPDYPQALVGWLHGLGVHADWTVADIGAGTGISSKLFLDAGHRVTAVEPNAAMRAAAERWLGSEGRFDAVDGSAEATGLAGGSVDLVVAAQAFHWFDKEKVRAEFARILSPQGLVAVFWNSRRLVGTPFLEGYERLLLEYGLDYRGVAERYTDDESMARWFGQGYRGMASIPHSQKLDHEGLLGRLMSSSYAPKPGHPNHEPMLHALRALFDATQEGGTVDFDYDTRVFAGRPDA